MERARCMTVDVEAGMVASAQQRWGSTDTFESMTAGFENPNWDEALDTGSEAGMYAEQAAQTPKAQQPQRSAAQWATAPDVKTANIPHFDKVKFGGEDAHFLCMSKDGKRLALGVLDGVGGSRSLDDPETLVADWVRVVTTKLSNVLSEQPELEMKQAVLQVLLGMPEAAPSTTLCFAILEAGKRLRVFNLGDSRLAVFRGAERVFITEPQQYETCWNAPFQVSSGPIAEEQLEGAVLSEVEVLPGDTIVIGSDGFWDNLFPNKAGQLVGEAIADRQGTATGILGYLAQAACDNRYSTDAVVPFNVSAAQAEGLGLDDIQLGGKEDDLTLLVLVVPELMEVEVEEEEGPTSCRSVEEEMMEEQAVPDTACCSNNSEACDAFDEDGTNWDDVDIIDLSDDEETWEEGGVEEEGGVANTACSTSEAASTYPAYEEAVDFYNNIDICDDEEEEDDACSLHDVDEWVPTPRTRSPSPAAIYSPTCGNSMAEAASGMALNFSTNSVGCGKPVQGLVNGAIAVFDCGQTDEAVGQEGTDGGAYALITVGGKGMVKGVSAAVFEAAAAEGFSLNSAPSLRSQALLGLSPQPSWEAEKLEMEAAAAVAAMAAAAALNVLAASAAARSSRQVSEGSDCSTTSNLSVCSRAGTARLSQAAGEVQALSTAGSISTSSDDDGASWFDQQQVLEPSISQLVHNTGAVSPAPSSAVAPAAAPLEPSSFQDVDADYILDSGCAWSTSSEGDNSSSSRGGGSCCLGGDSGYVLASGCPWSTTSGANSGSGSSGSSCGSWTLGANSSYRLRSGGSYHWTSNGGNSMSGTLGSGATTAAGGGGRRSRQRGYSPSRFGTAKPVCITSSSTGSLVASKHAWSVFDSAEVNHHRVFDQLSETGFLTASTNSWAWSSQEAVGGIGAIAGSAGLPQITSGQLSEAGFELALTNSWPWSTRQAAVSAGSKGRSSSHTIGRSSSSSIADDSEPQYLDGPLHCSDGTQQGPAAALAPLCAQVGPVPGTSSTAVQQLMAAAPSSSTSSQQQGEFLPRRLLGGTRVTHPGCALTAIRQAVYPSRLVSSEIEVVDIGQTRQQQQQQAVASGAGAAIRSGLSTTLESLMEYFRSVDHRRRAAAADAAHHQQQQDRSRLAEAKGAVRAAAHLHVIEEGSAALTTSSSSSNGAEHPAQGLSLQAAAAATSISALPVSTDSKPRRASSAASSTLTAALEGWLVSGLGQVGEGWFMRRSTSGGSPDAPIKAAPAASAATITGIAGTSSSSPGVGAVSVGAIAVCNENKTTKLQYHGPSTGSHLVNDKATRVDQPTLGAATDKKATIGSKKGIQNFLRGLGLACFDQPKVLC